MKILADLLSTDYGLMSFILIVVITIAMLWFGAYVYIKASKKK